MFSEVGHADASGYVPISPLTGWVTGSHLRFSEPPQVFLQNGESVYYIAGMRVHY